MKAVAAGLEDVRKLREMSGAGVLECKKALDEGGGDLERALDILRKKGAQSAQRKALREAREGQVASYIHFGGRIGVLVEMNCETDFVARTETFQNVGKELAMQVAATRPQYVSREEVPLEVLEKEKSIYRAEVQSKPAAVQEKILEGKLEKFYAESCLVDQPTIRDPKKRVKDLLTEAVTQTGENIVVRRFVRFELGETQAR